MIILHVVGARCQLDDVSVRCEMSVHGDWCRDMSGIGGYWVRQRIRYFFSVGRQCAVSQTQACGQSRSLGVSTGQTGSQITSVCSLSQA